MCSRHGEPNGADAVPVQMISVTLTTAITGDLHEALSAVRAVLPDEVEWGQDGERLRFTVSPLDNVTQVRTLTQGELDEEVGRG